ncbi:MAG: hypothetical protein IKJ80_02050 [Clostridia bacterium]|nr:hypothetical protein [Clostridia bacterium]
MKREDAFYHKILLMTGLDDGYDAWLNYYLESEDPLSDIVLELSCCGSDVNKIISTLHNYCAEQPFDVSAVCDRVRMFYHKEYYSKRMSKEEVISSMYRLARNVGDPGDAAFDDHLWGSMYYLDYYHALVKDGVISSENFDLAFFSYLDNGIPVDTNQIWGHSKKKQTFFGKIKSIIHR